MARHEHSFFFFFRHGEGGRGMYSHFAPRATTPSHNTTVGTSYLNGLPAARAPAAGAQFTCFVSTRVQILTQKVQRLRTRRLQPQHANTCHRSRWGNTASRSVCWTSGALRGCREVAEEEEGVVALWGGGRELS
jgi:hypothetical protein